MYDPCTLASEIKIPKFWEGKASVYPCGKREWKYDQFVHIADVWHVDPERGGSDDSCGWFNPRLSETELEWCKKEAGYELASKYPDLLVRDREPTSGEAITLIRDAFRKIRWQFYRSGKRFSFKESEFMLELACSRIDNLCGVFKINTSGSEYNQQYDAERMFYCLFRNYKRMMRPWWRHPRWHFWHWRINIPFVMRLKRWAFSRCGKCGGRFRLGYAPVSGCWDGTGPLWFRSEKDIFHSDCAK